MATQFKVGDRVRVVAERPANTREPECWVPPMGCVGVVECIDQVGGETVYGVALDDGRAWDYYPDWLTLVESAPLHAPNEQVFVAGRVFDTLEEADAHVAALDAVFETPEPAPPEPDPNRRRVSNQLVQVLGAVQKLEGDFEYQYGYNRELIEELAQAREEAKAANEQADAAEVAIREADAKATLASAKQAADRLHISRLEFELKLAGMRKTGERRWMLAALAGWALALVGGGLLALEKIPADPIDATVEKAIIYLNESAK